MRRIYLVRHKQILFSDNQYSELRVRCFSSKIKAMEYIDSIISVHNGYNINKVVKGDGNYTHITYKYVSNENTQRTLMFLMLVLESHKIY